MKSILIPAMALVFIAAIGCGVSETKSSSDSKPANTEPTGKQFLADKEPANPIPVGAARIDTKDGEEVSLVGRIGGSTKPFVEGLAAFTIVDPKVAICAPDCGCPTPWDYCCELDAVKTNIATIKVVDEKGKPIGEDARQLLGVKELSVVVVTGIAKRDEQGNLSVLAKKIFVKE